MPSILIVDKKSESHEMMKTLLEPLGYELVFAENLRNALKAYESRQPHIVVSDNSGPDMPGLELLKGLKKTHPEATVIMMDSVPEVQKVIQALKYDCFDYLRKPIRVTEFMAAIKRGLQSGEPVVAETGTTSGNGRTEPAICLALVGNHPGLVSAREQIEALSQNGSYLSLLIQGPAGIGKQMVARYLHEKCRLTGQFLQVDCRTLAREKFPEEIMGPDGTGGTIIKGALRGTLYLEHIQALPLDLQKSMASLTRTLGSQLRLVGVSETNMEDDLAQDLISIELYYHISLDTINLPALADRPDDVPLLAQAVLNHHPAIPAAARGATLSPEAVEKLKSYRWPGNIEELVEVLLQAAPSVRKGTLGAEKLALR